MRVRMLTTMAGPEGVVQADAVAEIENGQELVDGGYAVALEAPAEPKKADKPKKAEKATLETPETATADPHED